MPGVVSVMVAKNVACFMGAFHRIWMSNAANSSAWIRWAARPAAGQFGQLVQEGGVGAVPPGVFVQGVKLAGEGLAFAVQGDELLADAGTVGVSGLGGHAGRVVQFGDQVVLGGVGLLEPEPERGGLGVVAGLGVGGPGREEFSQPGGAAGGQGVAASPSRSVARRRSWRAATVRGWPGTAAACRGCRDQTGRCSRCSRRGGRGRGGCG